MSLRDRESLDFEEVCSCSLPQEHQKLTVIYLAISVKVSLVYHLLNIQLVCIHGVRVDYLGQVFFVKLPIFVVVQFLELLPEKLLVFLYSSIQAACNKFCVVNLSAVVKIHRIEDLIDILVGQFAIYLFPEVVQADHHLISGDHPVAVFIQLEKDFSEMIHLIF